MNRLTFGAIVRLFVSATRDAFLPERVVLGAIGVWLGCCLLGSSAYQPPSRFGLWIGEAISESRSMMGAAVTPEGVAVGGFEERSFFLLTGQRLVEVLTLPQTQIGQPISEIWRQMRDGRGTSWAMLAQVLIAWIGWSYFGGILCRWTACSLAGESIPVVGGIRSGAKRLVPALFAPLLPVLAITFLTAILVFTAMVLRAIAAVPVTDWLAAPFFLVAGVVIVILSAILVAGWGLFVAAIHIEGCDGFGGVSRVYNYLLSRYETAILCIAIAITFGVISALLAAAVLDAAVGLTAVMSTIGGPPIMSPSQNSLRAIVGLVLSGFAASWFWGAVATTYLVLRQFEDGVPADVLTILPEDRPKSDPLPVAGLAAMASDAASS